MQNIFSSIKKSSFNQKVIAGILVFVLICFYFLLPSKLFKNPTSFVIEDSDGNLLNATIAADGQWRFPYNKNVPQHFIDCITTYEDKRFYIHSGIDMSALGRALRANFKKIKTTQGGSTLTMQVIRMAEQNTNRNIWNKI